MRHTMLTAVSGIISISIILSGCGTSTPKSNVINTVPPSKSNTVSTPAVVQHTSQHAKWLTIHTESIGQLPSKIVGTSLSVNPQRSVIATGGYTGRASLQTVIEVTPQVLKIAALLQLTHDAASGYIGSDLYAFGGGQAVSYNTIVRVQNGKAQNVGTLPRPLSDAVCVPWSYQGSRGLLLLGGYDGQMYRKTVDYYSVNNGHLVSKALFSLPIGLRYTAAVVANGNLYWVGGQTTSGTSSTVYAWNEKSGVHIVAKLQKGLQKAALFYSNGFLIVTGGMDSNEHVSSDIYAIRLSDGTRKLIGHLPTPLADMGYTQVGAVGYLVGGDTGSGYSSKILKVTFN